MTLVTEKGFSVFCLCFIFLFGTTAYTQQLKPGEILYSRMPTDMNAPPTGANSPTIWVVGQDGSNDRKIADGYFPRISDDGRFIIFKRDTGAAYDPIYAFPSYYLRELATGQETLIRATSFGNYSTGYYFSPESNRGSHEIVFDWGCFMYKMDRDGTSVFRYPWENASYCSDEAPVIRRGDQRIAFFNYTFGSDGGLYTMEFTGDSRQKVAGTVCRDLSPAWSNDGRFLAYGPLYVPCQSGAAFPSTSYPYFISNLFKIKPDGSAMQQLTNLTNTQCINSNTNCIAMGLVWNEDNSKVIAAARINGVQGVFAFKTDGSGEYAQIPTTPGAVPDHVGGIVQTRIEYNVIAAGNGVTTGGNYTLLSTIGEAIAGVTSKGNGYSFESGFWTIPFDSSILTPTSTPSPTNTVTPTTTPSPAESPTATPEFVISGNVTYANAIPASTRFISNVQLNGSGSPPVFAVTDFPNGFYSLSGFGTGPYTVTPIKSGGVNGSITSFDAARIAQHVAGPPQPQLTGNQLIVADVTGNGSITSFDAGQVAKFAAGPPYAPPGVGLSGAWRFSPASRNYSLITSSISGENYSGLLMGEVTGNWTNSDTRPTVRPPTAPMDTGPEREIAVKLPNAVSKVDKEFVVPVSVEGIADKGIISYEFDLSYDPGVLQPAWDPIEEEATASRGLRVVANLNKAGHLRVIAYGAYPIDENGVLLNLRFKAVGREGSVSPLSFDRIMFNEGNSGVFVTDGQIELSTSPQNRAW